MIDALLTKIAEAGWTGGVVGLGYVGLPLVASMARAGVSVTGYDRDPAVVDALRAGRSHIDDLTDDDLAQISPRVAYTTDAAALRDADVLFICVPTPLRVGKQPDISFIETATRTIGGILRPGHLVVLESTTFPGTTEELIRPILEESGLRLDDDFLLAYSPERIDPSNTAFGTTNIPRVVGGASPLSGKAAADVYGRFVEKVHQVSDARTAEMTKLLENTFRWVNIGLVNELTTVARAIGVDIWEAIDAAATKPFGFMPFYPGPGVGGHCIPLDPFYLSWAARVTGETTRFVELAETINARMPAVVVGRIQEALNEDAKALRGSTILVVGVTYKPNVRDHRESPAIEVIHLLRLAGADVVFYDPFVAELPQARRADELDPAVRAADAVVIVTDHSAIDYQSLASNARVVVDTRNALGHRGIVAPNIRKL